MMFYLYVAIMFFWTFFAAALVGVAVTFFVLWLGLSMWSGYGIGVMAFTCVFSWRWNINAERNNAMFRHRAAVERNDNEID